MGHYALVGQLNLAHDPSNVALPGDAEVTLPSSVRSSQFPAISGALMPINGGSGLDGKPTTTHREDDERNAPTCSTTELYNKDGGTRL